MGKEVMKGFVTLMGKHLYVTLDNKNWYIIISELENKELNQRQQRSKSFFDFHGKSMSIEDLRNFIPDPDSLSWEEIKGDSIISPELQASNESYKISLVFAKELNDDDIIREFRNLFKN